MKKVVIVMVMLVMGMVLNAYAADLVQVSNKICPISHEAVGGPGMEPSTVTYNGKVYNLCCGMCEDEFKKDPEKYVKMVEAELSQAQEEKKM